MKILAIDIGKFKSVACIYLSNSAEHRFLTIATNPQDFHDLIVDVDPDRVVIEIGSQAGWICDMVRALKIEIQVANPNHEGWRWKSVKRKTDRDDALKLAQLSIMNQLPIVYVPSKKIRQWRNLINFRHTFVRRRTQVKNSIRALLDRQGLSMPKGRNGWSRVIIEKLEALARPIVKVNCDNLWSGQLYIELEALREIEAHIVMINSKLEILAKSDKRVMQLQSIPGVGPRLAEIIVATIDDPKRFKNAKQVGAYAGLVPRQYESGSMLRHGRISGQGNKLLRALLIEVSWVMLRYNSHMQMVFNQLCRGSKARRKIAIVAAARRLLVWCWAMLRDGTTWQPNYTVAALK